MIRRLTRYAGVGTYESVAGGAALEKVAGPGALESDAGQATLESVADPAHVDQPTRIVVERMAGEGRYTSSAGTSQLELMAGAGSLARLAGKAALEQDCGLADRGFGIHPGHAWDETWIPTVCRHNGGVVWNLWWTQNVTWLGTQWGNSPQNWRLTNPAGWEMGTTKAIKNLAISIANGSPAATIPLSITIVNYGKIGSAGGAGGNGKAVKDAPRGGGGGGGAGFQAGVTVGGGNGGVNCDGPNDQACWGDDGTEIEGGDGGGVGDPATADCVPTAGASGGVVIRSWYNGPGLVRFVNHSQCWAGGGGGSGGSEDAVGKDGGAFGEDGEDGPVPGGGGGTAPWGDVAGKNVRIEEEGSDILGSIYQWAPA